METEEHLIEGLKESIETGEKSENMDDGDDSDKTDALWTSVSGRSTYRNSQAAHAGFAAGDSTCPSVRASTALMDSYDFSHARRGDAIIINNRKFNINLGMDERRGTDTDATNLCERFQELGFNVNRFDNQTRKEILNIIDAASKADHSESDCLVVAMLSHGEDGVIYSTDNKLQISEITEPFRPTSCPSLAAKPKIFFFQACRGHQLDHGHDLKDADTLDGTTTQRIPVMADFLFAYSVVPGFYSWRNSEAGSWFVQALCHVLKTHAHQLDLTRMLTRVSRHVAYDWQSNAGNITMTGKKQVPCIVSTLTKDVWFTRKHTP